MYTGKTSSLYWIGAQYSPMLCAIHTMLHANSTASLVYETKLAAFWQTMLYRYGINRDTFQHTCVVRYCRNHIAEWKHSMNFDDLSVFVCRSSRIQWNVDKIIALTVFNNMRRSLVYPGDLKMNNTYGRKVCDVISLRCIGNAAKCTFRYSFKLPWASCPIRKIAVCACAGNAGNVFPTTAGKRHARAIMHVGIAN